MKPSHRYLLFSQWPGLAVFYGLPLLWALLMLLPVQSQQWLYLDIEKMWAGQYWRFFSGHFIHHGWQHFWLNTMGLLMLQPLFPGYIQQGRWLVTAVFILLAVSAGLLLFSEQLNWYVGFSGILTGLYIAAALKYYVRQRLVSAGVLLLVGVYTLAQQWQGELVGGLLSALPSASRAHLAGMIAGACWGVLALGLSWISRQNK